ncbi:MAG: ribonuclease H-like domain-containing protein [Anaerolineaceae bacterium]|nr:ribonuclease H-like domain-containing protein [Anaerolineaceae bacterium]
MDSSESLADKLKSLGVHLGLPKNYLPAAKLSHPIEQLFPNGYEEPTSFGEIFVVENTYSPNYQQGNAVLTSETDTLLIQKWAKLSATEPYRQNKFLFLDTETSGLAGGTGTYPFMVGLGYYSEQGFTVVQLFMRSPKDEPALLSSLSRRIEPFEVVVTFNGKSFDIPILNTRHILNGFFSPFKTLEHIDLLHLSRQIWRNRLRDRSLGSLEKEVLQMSRDQLETPGWLVPQIYFDYLKTGDARPLKGVFYHNEIDIISLAALMNYINNMLLYPIAENVKSALDMIALAKVFESLGLIDQAVLCYESGLTQGLPTDHFIHTLLSFAFLYRKRGNWEQAIKLWEKASEYGQPQACIELAKYYEHSQKDYQQAQIWAEQGFAFLSRDKEEHFKNRLLQKDLTHRLNRIKKKTERTSRHA